NLARRAARTVRAVNAYEHSATMVRRTGRVFAPNVGLDVGSSSVIRSGVIRALRQSGDPNALATAKAISTGRLELKLGRIPDARKPQGRYGWKDTIEVDTTNLTGRQAAGFAAHEGKHWADGLKPSTYFMDKYRYEFDAYKVQESVDPGMRKLYEIDSGDNALMEFVKK